MSNLREDWRGNPLPPGKWQRRQLLVDVLVTNERLTGSEPVSDPGETVDNGWYHAAKDIVAALGFLGDQGVMVTGAEWYDDYNPEPGVTCAYCPRDKRIDFVGPRATRELLDHQQRQHPDRVFPGRTA